MRSIPQPTKPKINTNSSVHMNVSVSFAHCIECNCLWFGLTQLSMINKYRSNFWNTNVDDSIISSFPTKWLLECLVTDSSACRLLRNTCRSIFDFALKWSQRDGSKLNSVHKFIYFRLFFGVFIFIGLSLYISHRKIALED